MSYHRPTHGAIGEHYGTPGGSPSLVAPVLGGMRGGACGVGGFALGSDARKTELHIARGDEVSLYDKLNLDISRALAPFRSVVNAMPMSATDKSKLLGSPLTFVIDIFDPFEDAIGAACDRVIAQKGAVQRPFWLLGKAVSVMRKPAVDNNLDANTRNIVRRLRTANAFIVLANTQPIETIVECAREGLSIADGMRHALGLDGLGSYSGGLGVTGGDDAAGLAALLASLGLSAELSAAIMTAIGALVTATGGALAVVIGASGQAAAASLLPKPITPGIRTTTALVGPVFTPVKIGPATTVPAPASSGVPTVAILAGAAALVLLVVARKKG